MSFLAPRIAPGIGVAMARVAVRFYFFGGLQSSYGLLFFLIILFSYFYNLAEMFSITTVVTLFYLLPYIYDGPHSRHIAISAVQVLFFYLGRYSLYSVARFPLGTPVSIL